MPATLLDLAGADHRTAIRVATVPADHVYVRHVDPESPLIGEWRVERLADPDPDFPARSAVSRWWPPAMLEPEWVADNHARFDIFHVQFGFDARSPAQLADLTHALRENGRPLIYTVHDLRNPHHEARAAHDAHLDVLVPAAARLITLTPGAAAEIKDRWGRDAVVLPHPHVVDFARMRSAHTHARAVEPDAEGEFRVGVHVKSLRASMDPLPVIRVLVEAVRDIPGAVLQVNGHTDVLDPAGARYERPLAEYLHAAASAGLIELEVHDFFEDGALWDYLESLTVSVLPYRFGTHSGWMEACRDLGTAVIAPDCGFYRDQGPVFSYDHSEAGLDAATLVRAVHEAHERRPPAPASIADRRAERQRIATAHARLYGELLA